MRFHYCIYEMLFHEVSSSTDNHKNNGVALGPACQLTLKFYGCHDTGIHLLAIAYAECQVANVNRSGSYCSSELSQIVLQKQAYQDQRCF